MFQLSDYLTPLVRNILIYLVISLVIQWGVGAPFVALLAWHPFGMGFAPWQPLSAFLIASTQLQSLIFDWIIILFSLGTVDRILGRRPMLQALALCWALAVAVALGASALGLVAPTVYSGQTALCVALLTLFCFSLPDAQVRLLLVLPVKSSWVGWGLGLFALYNVAAWRDLGSWLGMGSWISAVLWTRGISGDFRRLKLKMQRRQIEKRLEKFSVIEGGKGKQDPWVH